MDKASFTNVIGKLYIYFRYAKMPTDIQIDLWHQECKFIPVVALDWIFDQLKSGESLPRNLPKEMISLWYSYRKAHPEKSMTEYEYCEDCFGHGIHMFKILEDIYNPPMWISYTAMCSECNNWKKQFGSVARNGGKLFIEGKPIGKHVPKVLSLSKQEIIDRGYEYLPLSDPKEKKIIPTNKTDDLSDGMLKGV